MIEAIPNVSEGKDAAVITALENTVRAIPGIVYLGTSPDPDHNRTVLSFAADDAATILEAGRRLYRSAIERIDLRLHRGEHPRVGAVDVFPVIPLGATSLDSCLELAIQLAREISSEHGLPVFLYEESAASEHRRPLPSIRRGGLEALTERMRTDPWIPDLGPAIPHPSAGVSVIGARRPLIAFNIQLATDDIAVADAIARAVRESSGGLPAVRAIPIRLASRGIVQVSMNLLDFTRTSMFTAFEEVRRQAAARGIEVLSSELIGLAPTAALASAAAEAMKIERFSPRMVLETEIEAQARLAQPSDPRVRE